MRPGGLMVPSQTRIMLAGMTGEKMYDEAFGFWDEVYGESRLCSCGGQVCRADDEYATSG